MELATDNFCFVCGPDNPEGLHASFRCEDGKATGTFRPRDVHQGYAGVSHGGIVAALLDEAMVYAAASLGHWSATAEMTVRYHKPVPTNSEELSLRAEVVRQQRRIIECRAELCGGDGTLLASATAKLMQGRPLSDVEKQARVGLRQP